MKVYLISRPNCYYNLSYYVSFKKLKDAKEYCKEERISKDKIKKSILTFKEN